MNQRQLDLPGLLGMAVDIEEGGAQLLQELRRCGEPFVICSDNPAIYQRGLAEGLFICDMKQQYEVAKRFLLMEGPN